jgi:hypothetical protein
MVGTAKKKLVADETPITKPHVVHKEAYKRLYRACC